MYDAKGRFVVHRITKEEASYKLCKVKRLAFGKGGIPHIGTHDGRTVRYPDPEIKVRPGGGGRGLAGTGWGLLAAAGARGRAPVHAPRPARRSSPLPPALPLPRTAPQSVPTPLRHAPPRLQVNDTVMLDLESGKVKDFIKFDVGNLAMATGGHNNGRVGTIVHKEKHKGSFDIVHIKDAGGWPRRREQHGPAARGRRCRRQLVCPLALLHPAPALTGTWCRRRCLPCCPPACSGPHLCHPHDQCVCDWQGRQAHDLAAQGQGHPAEHPAGAGQAVRQDAGVSLRHAPAALLPSPRPHGARAGSGCARQAAARHLACLRSSRDGWRRPHPHASPVSSSC